MHTHFDIYTCDAEHVVVDSDHREGKTCVEFISKMLYISFEHINSFRGYNLYNIMIYTGKMLIYFTYC